MNFSSSRLRIARQRRGLTMEQLAERAQVSRRMLSDYEAGERKPSLEMRQRLARALDFAPGFFEQPEVPVLTSEMPSFRALSKMSAGQRDAALAAGTLGIEIAGWLDQYFDLPVPKVPEVKHLEPEQAAAVVRAEWNLGEQPLGNAVHLLEAMGVRVFSMAEDCREIDAFSLWHNGIPFVFLNTRKSAERSRFDACHELGHLVLHRSNSLHRGREAEDQADAFASAFLMPRGSVVAHRPHQITLDAILRLKKIWSVSAFAMVRRLHDVGALSSWIYRQLCIQMSQNGWRTNEPLPGHRETSKVLDMVFESLQADGKTPADIARALWMPVQEFDALTFRPVFKAINGGREDGRDPKNASKHHLHRVKLGPCVLKKARSVRVWVGRSGFLEKRKNNPFQPHATPRSGTHGTLAQLP